MDYNIAVPRIVLMKRKRPSRIFDDTTPAAEAKLIELLRLKTPQEKLRMVNQLNAGVRTVTMSGLKLRFPDADGKELKLKLAEMLLGPERARTVYETESRVALDE